MEPVDPDMDPDMDPAVDPPVPPSLEWDVVAVIGIGGALGSLARWGVGELVPHAHGAFAWSTFLDNVPGAFLLGLLSALVFDVWAHTRLVRPFWGIGVLGGYTTFSTWMLDAHDMVRVGAIGTAAAYVVSTLVLGVVSAWAGLWWGRRFA